MTALADTGTPLAPASASVTDTATALRLLRADEGAYPDDLVTGLLDHLDGGADPLAAQERARWSAHLHRVARAATGLTAGARAGLHMAAALLARNDSTFPPADTCPGVTP